MKILVLTLLLSLVPACSRSGATNAPSTIGAEAAAPAVAVEAATIEARELDRFVEAVGTLDPNETVTVSNQVEGIVQQVFVDLGDAVRQGQVLAQLDTRELELAVQQQQAALQQELARLSLADENTSLDEASTSQVRHAEANFSDAKLALERAKKLTDEQVIARQQLDQAQARYDVAEAAVRSAHETVRNIRATISARKASVDLARKKLEDARIEAPLAGFIQERSITEGQFLKDNSPVVIIVQSSPLKLRVEVPEMSVSNIGPGRPVQFTVDSYPDRTFEGKVSRLAPSVNQQSRTLKLEALVNNADAALKPGQFARVTIQTDRRETVLVAPKEALFTFAGLEKLFVIENGKVSERIVRSGSQIDGVVEIVEGVNEGDRVAVSNLGNLQQGREVSVR